MGDILNSLKNTKVIVALITIMLILTAFIIPSAFFYESNSQQVGDGISYYSADSQKAVLLAGGYSKNAREMNSMAKWLSRNDINVVYAVYKEDFSSFTEAINFLKTSGFENENIAVIGYDMGGFYLLNHLSREDVEFGSAILLSPYYKDFDERSIPVINTSYVNNIDWLNSIEPLSYKQPTSILTTTLDDIASPVLTTVMYNHISGDDILLSANTYGAQKGDIEFNVISGINHLYVPYSKAIMEHVGGYLNTNMGWGIKGAPSFPVLMLASWVVLPIAMLGALFYIYSKVRYKFYTVSYNIDSCGDAKKRTVLWYRLLASIGAIPVSYLVYKQIAKLEFSNIAQLVIISYMFSVSVLMYLILKFGTPNKSNGVLGEVNLKPGNKGLIYSILIGAVVLAMLTMQSITGMFSVNIKPNTLTLAVVFVMAMVAFYISSIEAEILSSAKLTVSTNTMYYVIKLVPYIVLLAWNMFVSRHTISLVYFRNIILMAVVLVMGRVFMEITGHRKITAIIMAIVFVIPMLVFTIPVI